MAFDDFNRSEKSFKVHYISEDDKSDKTDAVKVARDLVEADHVNVILGPAISPSAISIGGLVDAWRLPAIAKPAVASSCWGTLRHSRGMVIMHSVE